MRRTKNTKLAAVEGNAGKVDVNGLGKAAGGKGTGKISEKEGLCANPDTNTEK